MQMAFSSLTIAVHVLEPVVGQLKCMHGRMLQLDDSSPTTVVNCKLRHTMPGFIFVLKN